MSLPAAPASRRKFVENAGVAERQLGGVEHLAHVQAGERDLRRAGEVELVALDRVDVRAVGREEAGAVHRLLADEHRRQHRQVAVRRGAVEREPVEREREQRRVAEHVAEARAGQPGGALHVEAADLGVLLRLCELRRLADPAELRGVLVGEAVRRRVVRRVRQLGERRLARRVRFGQLLLGLLELLLHPAQLLELLRRRLALHLRAGAQLVDAGNERPPALVDRQPGVERLGRALAREPAPEPVRVAAGGARVDHARESRYASRRAATPSSSAEGTTRSARARMSRWEFATATAKPAQSSSSRSFSPSPQATVCAAVKPSRSATNWRPAPLLTSGWANSRKCGSDFEMKRRPRKRGFSSASSSSRASGSPTATSLVGSSWSQSRSGPTGWISRFWKSAYARASGVDLRDVEQVVHVAVDVKAARDERVDHLERERPRDADVAQELARGRIGDDRALVADHRVVEPGLEHVRANRPEHAPGDDDHVHARRAGRRDRGGRAGADHRVLGHERPVEVARERAHLAREARGQLDRGYGVPPVDFTT